MISAVSSSQTNTIKSSTSPSKSGLEAKIERYQKELAECIACPSSKTSEGKATIETISNKIGTTKAQLKEVTDSSSNSVENSKQMSNTSNSTLSNSSDSGIGNLVNVYA